MSSTCHLACDFKCFLQEFVAATSTVMIYCSLQLQQLKQPALLCSLVLVQEFSDFYTSEKYTNIFALDWDVVMEATGRKTDANILLKRSNNGVTCKCVL